MRVGLITYQHGHRKTLELTLKLMTKGYDISWFAFPFKKREPKNNGVYQDRPSQLLDLDQMDFSRRYQVGYWPVDGWTDDFAHELSGCDVYLNCIAKIIPASFIEGRMILNCHPGLLPKNRGVDAFKWSIIKGWPIGVTLHKIDEEIDRGTILYRRTVPILTNDTLADVCLRAYNFEVDLLANFHDHLPSLNNNWLVGDEYPISHKRIPKHLDEDLESIFRATQMFLGMSVPHLESYPD